MSKTLVIAQLQQLELETYSIVQDAQQTIKDRKILLILEKAEVEHARRAKNLKRILDDVYGSYDWKKELCNERCGLGDSSTESSKLGKFEQCEAAETRLNQMYKMASQLVRNPVVIDAALEQEALWMRFVEHKFLQTKKMAASA